MWEQLSGSKEPIPAATTDDEGPFTLSANEGDVLVVSYYGYLTKEIEVGSQSSISQSNLNWIQLQLEDVVVVAYGVQKRSDVTGAIGSVEAKDFNQGIVVNPGQLLQGEGCGGKCFQRKW